MAGTLIMVDTSILIDYYRKSDKQNSAWVGLVKRKYRFAISVVTKYEIYSGASKDQLQFWDKVLKAVSILSLDEVSINKAVVINSSLKHKRKQIDLADLFIAATALSNHLPIATLNKKHFERVEELQLIE